MTGALALLTWRAGAPTARWVAATLFALPFALVQRLSGAPSIGWFFMDFANVSGIATLAALVSGVAIGVAALRDERATRRTYAHTMPIHRVHYVLLRVLLAHGLGLIPAASVAVAILLTFATIKLPAGLVATPTDAVLHFVLIQSLGIALGTLFGLADARGRRTTSLAAALGLALPIGALSLTTSPLRSAEPLRRVAHATGAHRATDLLAEPWPFVRVLP